MNDVIVACVQQQMRVYETQDEYRRDVYKFLRMAKAKEARLVVFPELSGVMLAPPLISGFKLGLLKTAHQAGRSVFGRLKRKVAGSTAGVLGGGLRGSLIGLLEAESGALREAYLELFSKAAQEFDAYIVAGSLYLPDETGQAVHNVAYVFGPQGQVLGSQPKVGLHADERDLCEAGERIQVFDTDFGRLGIVIGTESLYPEQARILAFQGAEMLVGVAACPGQVLSQKVRRAFEARVQENQLFGLISFLVGRNGLGQRFKDDFVGKSALLAPMELTPRFNGVSVEMGTAAGEGIIALEWDAAALRDLWDTADVPVRRELNMAVYGEYVARLYGRGATIEDSYAEEARPPEVLPVAEVAAGEVEWPVPGEEVPAEVEAAESAEMGGEAPPEKSEGE